MNGDDANGSNPSGGSIEPDAGTSVTDVSDVGDTQPSTEREPSEPSSVRDVTDSSGSEATSAAVSAGVPVDAASERHHAAGADGDREPGGQRRSISTADWITEKRQTMSVLIDFLKANGASDADIEAMKPLLDNQKFSSKLESELAAKGEYEKKYTEVSGRVNEFESERNKAIAERDDATKKESELRTWWDTQASPAVDKIRQEALRESERRAQLETRLSRAKELYGFDIPDDNVVPGGVPGIPSAVPGTGAAAAAAAGVQPRQDLPDLSKYVTMDVLQQQADMVGSAIALAQDLSFEHSQLFGNSKPMNFGDLRKKAAAERQDIRAIWERDYGVASRRAEIQATENATLAKQRSDELEAARSEGYQKGLSQVSSPMTRSADAGSSRFGVAFSQRDTTAGKPWDIKPMREQSRLEKVIGSLAKQGSA